MAVGLMQDRSGTFINFRLEGCLGEQFVLLWPLPYAARPSASNGVASCHHGRRGCLSAYPPGWLEFGRLCGCVWGYDSMAVVV